MAGTFRSWFGGKKDEAPEQPAAAQPALDGGAASFSAPIDFVAVLTAAGIQNEVRDRVGKAKQLLRSMPPDARSATKRQIVEAAFQAFEIPTQRIIEGASAEIEALRAYIKVGEEEKAAKLVEGESRIAELEGEIRDVRASMAFAVAAQERRQRLTTEEIATVQPIVQFFVQEATDETAGARNPSAEPDPFIEPDDDASSGSSAKPDRR